MKKRFAFLLMCFLLQDSVKAQVTPYTGGDGGGYAANQSATSNCLLYIGGDGSGYGTGNSPRLNCPMFLGDSADGSASNYSPVIVCPSFFGGIGDGYDTGSFKFCQILLPIKILDFSGVKETNRNMLYWRVADAQDLRWFEVERSGDGVNFTKIAVVHAAGNQYQLADNAPLAGTNFYRLSIVEKGGQISYSGVVVLRSFAGSQFTVYPNPAKGHANVYYQSAIVQTVSFCLYNMNGNRVVQQRLQLRKGSNYLLLHFENIPSGVYMLIIPETGDRLRLVVL